MQPATNKLHGSISWPRGQWPSRAALPWNTLFLTLLMVLACLGLACTETPKTSGKPGPAKSPQVDEPSPRAPEFQFTVRYSAGAESTAPLPLIVALHWMTGSSQSMAEHTQFERLPIPARLVFPQADLEEEGGFSWWTEETYELPLEEQTELIIVRAAQIQAMLLDLQQRYPTEGLPIVCGLSQGSEISLMLATRHPESVAGAVAIAPRLPSSWWQSPEVIASTVKPLLVLQGDSDHAVDAKTSTEAAAQMKAAGIPLEYRLYQGAGHELSVEMRQDAFVWIEALLGSGPPLGG